MDNVLGFLGGFFAWCLGITLLIPSVTIQYNIIHFLFSHCAKYNHALYKTPCDQIQTDTHDFNTE